MVSIRIRVILHPGPIRWKVPWRYPYDTRIVSVQMAVRETVRGRSADRDKWRESPWHFATWFNIRPSLTCCRNMCQMSTGIMRTGLFNQITRDAWGQTEFGENWVPVSNVTVIWIELDITLADSRSNQSKGIFTSFISTFMWYYFFI